MRTRTSRVSTIGLVTSVLVSAGCGGPHVVLRLAAGDCDEQTPCTIDFGTVDVGDESVVAIDLVNTGASPAVIANTAISGDAVFKLLQLPPKILAAQASAPIALSADFPDSASAPAPSALTVIYDDSSGAKKTITAKLEAVGDVGETACPTATPCTFASAPVGSSSSCIVTLRNDGGDDTIVNDVGFSNGIFAISGGLVVPALVSAHSTLDLPITGTPAVQGDNAGALNYSCGTSVKTVTLSVEGT
jgi:hypothetical protein